MAGEPSIGLNAFHQAKYKNESETVAQAFITLLFARKGFMPSMPELGIHIQDTIYMFWDDISIEGIKAMIVSQCEPLQEYISSGDLDVIKSTNNNQPLLIVVVPTQIKNVEKRLVIGITTDSDGNMKYNYQYMSEEEYLSSS